MAEPVSEQDQEFSELLGFLQDQKPEVQRAAAEGVLDHSENRAFVEYCRRHPRAAARPLLRLAERAEADAQAGEVAEKVVSQSAAGSENQKARLARDNALNTMEAGAAALKALVNLSAIPQVTEELVSLNAPKRITEALRSGWLEGRAGLAHWHAMILANITIGKVGQQALCVEDGMLRFLMAAYVTKPRPKARDGYNDPLLCLGKVLGNVCVLPEGRKIVAGEQGTGSISALIADLSERGRRADMMNALRNLCLDTACHEKIVSTDMFARMACFLYPFEKAEVERRAELPEAVRALLETEGSTLTGDVAVRTAAVATIIGLNGSLEGREYLRGFGCQEVLRAWTVEETDSFILAGLGASLRTVESTEEELKAADEQQEKEDAEAEASAAQEPNKVICCSPDSVEASKAPLPSADPAVNASSQGTDEHLKDIFSGIDGVD
ncbi:unnamed protein product [Polarella glacialis]|uniref:Protein HGH1 N-terminal domain-containing protein n=1 Tax=Polarella glacialis TaxID=89957 RepID=A0A813IE82_POLGL|nr:unnamed protein product [Polarella glacialis]CAE8649212.1 unnamed protein product [Polarella glacialis]